MSKHLNTEWMLKLSEEGSTDVDSVVVYRTESALDADGEPSGIKRLWVAARGYEGGGIVGAFSAVASLDENFNLGNMASCQQAFAEGDDFEPSENYDMLTDSDLKVLEELWNKVDELAAFDPDAEVLFVAKVSVPQGQGCIASEGWDPEDLLEPVSEEWQLLLEF